MIPNTSTSKKSIDSRGGVPACDPSAFSEEEWIDVESLPILSTLEYRFLNDKSHFEDGFLTSSNTRIRTTFLSVTPLDGLGYSASGLSFPVLLKEELPLSEKRILAHKKDDFKSKNNSFSKFASAYRRENELVVEDLEATVESGKRELNLLQLFLVFLCVLLLGWFMFAFWQHKQRDFGVGRSDAKEENVVAEKVNNSEAALRSVNTFISAETVEEVKPLVVRDASIDEHLEKYWKPFPIKDVKVEFYKFHYFAESSEVVYVFNVRLPYGGVRVIPVLEDESGHYYIDWRAYACIQDMSIPDFKNANIDTAVLMRGSVSLDNYYNEGYDENLWISCKLTSCEMPGQYLYFYLKRKSEQASWLSKLFKKEALYSSHVYHRNRVIIKLKKREGSDRGAMLVDSSNDLSEVYYLKRFIDLKKAESITSD